MQIHEGKDSFLISLRQGISSIQALPVELMSSTATQALK